MATKGPTATSKFLCFPLRDRLVALARDVLRVGAGLLRLGVQQLVDLGAHGEVDVVGDLCKYLWFEDSLGHWAHFYGDALGLGQHVVVEAVQRAHAAEEDLALHVQRVGRRDSGDGVDLREKHVSVW